VFLLIENLLKEKKAVSGRIMCKNKLNEVEELVKYKVYVGVQRFSQIPGLDFTRTFTSVLNSPLFVLFLLFLLTVTGKYINLT